MSRTKNPFQLIEDASGGLFESLAAKEEEAILYQELEGFDYGNITTGNKLEFSTTSEIPKRHIFLQRADINSNNISITLFSSAPEPNASLRVIAANSQEIFQNLDFSLKLNTIQKEIFHPVVRRNYNKKFPLGVRVTDTVLKKGVNKISFKDFKVEAHLHLFFVFYYDNDDDFQIYSQELLIQNAIMESDMVVDNRVPAPSAFSFNFIPSTDKKLYLDYLQSKQQQALFSKFYHTVDPKSNLRFLFAFDAGRHISENVLFPELLQELNLEEFIQSFEVERYWQGRSVGFMMKDNRYPKTLKIHIIDNVATSEGIIFFGGMDGSVEKGLYTYSTNIVMRDITIDEAEARVAELQTIEQNLLQLEDLAPANNEDLMQLITLFPSDFLFLAERVETQTRVSEQLIKKVVDKIHNKIKDYERRLVVKAAAAVPDTPGASLLKTFAYNSTNSARRLATIKHTFPTVEFKKYRNMGLGLTLDDEMSFKKIKRGDIKEYMAMYKENIKSIMVIKEPPLKSIRAYDEFNNTYDDYATGSLYAGVAQVKDHEVRKRPAVHKIQISKRVGECKIEYLANYNTSPIDDKRSVHSDNWIEIEGEEDIKRLPTENTILFRVKTPEPIYDKYFFVKNDYTST